MTASATAPAARIVGIAPQFLVGDLQFAIAHYRDRLGFVLDFCYEDFYASVSRDGFAIHLKHGTPSTYGRVRRRAEEHLDAYVRVTGVATLYEEMRARDATISRGLDARPWNCLDFYVEDPDGHVLCFSEPTP